MADSKVSALTGLSGSSVDVDNDVLPIVDASAGNSGSKKISVKELIANTSSFVQSGIASAVARTVSAKLGEIKSFEDFGAVGDGSTDDATAINLGLTWLAGAANRGLSATAAKTYIVGSRLNLTSASTFAIFGNGAFIKAKNARTVVAGDQVLVFTSCTDGYIENLNVDSNRANRTPIESSSHGIQIYTSCARLTFFNVKSDNATTDGWLLDSVTPNTLATLPTDIRLIHCSGKNAYRNNLSLINSVRFRDYYGIYNDANGTNPEAGVDCEPDVNTTQGNQDARFYGTQCSGNVGQGFSNALSNSHCFLFNVVANDNDDGGIQNAGGTMYIDGAHCEDYTSTVSLGVVTSSVDAVVSDFRNLTFENVVLNTQSKACVYVSGTGTNVMKVSGVSAHDVQAGLVYCAVRAHVSDVKATKFASTDGPCVSLATAKSVLDGLTVQHTAGGDRSVNVTASDCIVRNVTLQNPGASSGGTIGVIEFAAGALRGTAEGINIRQDTSIPSGQQALKFTETPLSIRNVTAYSAGTDYTSTNVLMMVAGSGGAPIDNVRPVPDAESWTPVFKDGTTTITVTINYAKIRRANGITHLRASVTRNDATAYTGTLNLSGFPYPFADGTSHAASGTCWIDNAANDITAMVYANGAVGNLLQTETVGTKIMTTDQWENGRHLYLSLTVFGTS